MNAYAIRAHCHGARLTITFGGYVCIRYTQLAERRTYALTLSFPELRAHCTASGVWPSCTALLSERPDVDVTDNWAILAFGSNPSVIFTLPRAPLAYTQYASQSVVRSRMYIDTPISTAYLPDAPATAHSMNTSLLFGREEAFDNAIHGGYTWPNLDISRITPDGWHRYGTRLCWRLADIIIVTGNQHVAHISRIVTKLAAARPSQCDIDALRRLSVQLDLARPIDPREDVQDDA